MCPYKHMALEKLSFRTIPDTTQPMINVPLTRHLVYDVFRYQGLLDKDGNFTPIPYKDDNATRLAGNYSAAHVRLAFAYREQGNLRAAFQELDRADRISSDFPGVAL